MLFVPGTLTLFQRAVLYLGLLISTCLLVRFAFDFSHFNKTLFAAMSLLLTAAIVIAAWNILTESNGQSTRTVAEDEARALLLVAIPVGLLTSSLDCTGLALRGCTSYCTFVKLILIPLSALMSYLSFQTGRNIFLVLALLVASGALVPHCLCYNPANGWWIDNVGASPQCYLWGFVGALISVSALLKGGGLWLSVSICYVIISGSFSFFIAHHYFQFPW